VKDVGGEVRCFDASMHLIKFTWEKRLGVLVVQGSLNGGKFCGYVRETNPGAPFGVIEQMESAEQASGGIVTDSSQRVCLSFSGIYSNSYRFVGQMVEFLDSLDAKSESERSVAIDRCLNNLKNFDFACEVRGDFLVGLSERYAMTLDNYALSYCLKFFPK
jgi:hypothetical protein